MLTTFRSVNLNRRDHLTRARYRWEDDIKMVIQETGCEKMGWTHVFKDIDQ
jgi:hypothetical protein